MTRLFSLIGAILIFTLASCSKSDDNGGNGNAQIQFVLTDGPGDYDAVYVNIKEVLINVGQAEPGGSSNGTWVSYPLRPGFDRNVNLLELRNGKFTYMGEPLALPAGDISQLRLVLEETGNKVVVDGVEHDLTTPSAQQSGLKINFHQTLEPGNIYRIWLDFDAGKSVVATGSGKYNLKPVIRAFVENADFGSISGIVLPAEAGATVYLVKNADTLATAIPEVAGSTLGLGFFKFANVEAGSNYTLRFAPSDSTLFIPVTMPGIVVENGKITSITTTTLQHR